MEYVGATTSSSAPTEAGTYDVNAVFDGNGDNFNAGTVLLGTYTIAKITPTSSELASYSFPSGFPYDGTDNGVSVSVSLASPLTDPNGLLTVEYVDDGGNPLPSTPTEAGAYTINAVVDGNGDNFNAATIPLTGTYTIAKATPGATDLDFTPSSNVYNGSLQGVTVSAVSPKSGLGTPTVKYDDGINPATTTPPTEPGTYTITVGIDATSTNFEATTTDLTLSGNYTITKKSAPTGVNQTVNMPIAGGTISYALTNLLPTSGFSDAGSVTYDIVSVTDGSSILTTPAAGTTTTGGTQPPSLVLDVVTTGSAGATATVVIKVYSDYYDDFTATITVALTAETPVTISGVSTPNAYETGSPYAEADFTGLTIVETVSGAPVTTLTEADLTKVYTGANAPNAPTAAGSYTLTVSVPSGGTYIGSAIFSFDILPVTAPTISTVVIAAVSSTELEVTTTLLDDGGQAPDYYTLSASDGDGTATYTRTTSTATIPAVSGKTYTVTVTAHNATGGDGNSIASNSVTIPAPTPPAPAPQPAAPSNVKATAGDAQATVTFTANNAGKQVDNYTVVSTPGGIEATDTKSPIKVEGLTNGTEYTFKVTVNFKDGSSMTSVASAKVTPKASGTGIDDVEEVPTLKLYPNPASDIVTITGLQGDETIRFYDANGRSVLTHQAKASEEVIPVSQLQKGIYIVRIGTKALKLVKI